MGRGIRGERRQKCCKWSTWLQDHIHSNAVTIYDVMSSWRKKNSSDKRAIVGHWFFPSFLSFALTHSLLFSLLFAFHPYLLSHAIPCFREHRLTYQQTWSKSAPINLYTATTTCTMATQAMTDLPFIAKMNQCLVKKKRSSEKSTFSFYLSFAPSTCCRYAYTHMPHPINIACCDIYAKETYSSYIIPRYHTVHW